MTDPLRTPVDYELFIYTLTAQFHSVRRSNIAFVRIGASLARVAGELQFDQDLRLVVRERIVYNRLPAVIDGYGYEVWRSSEKLYWYDSQSHTQLGTVSPSAKGPSSLPVTQPFGPEDTQV